LKGLRQAAKEFKAQGVLLWRPTASAQGRAQTGEFFLEKIGSETSS
jgi:hypothetical protein